MKLLSEQKNCNKCNRTHYVFDQRHSFYPANIPIKYGFEIRSLIKNNHLPLWKFNEQDKNQIIFQKTDSFPLKKSINQNLSNYINSPFTFLSSISPIHKYPQSIDSQIQHHWINTLLNSGQSKGQDRQLSSTTHSSSIPNAAVSSKALCDISLLSEKYINKRRTQRQSKCLTFEEYFQQYYFPKLCLIYSRNF